MSLEVPERTDVASRRNYAIKVSHNGHYVSPGSESDKTSALRLEEGIILPLGVVAPIQRS